MSVCHYNWHNIFRGVNLAQPTGLGLGPCGLGPKKAHIEKKAPIKEAHKAKNPPKVLWVKDNP